MSQLGAAMIAKKCKVGIITDLQTFRLLLLEGATDAPGRWSLRCSGPHLCFGFLSPFFQVMMWIFLRHAKPDLDPFWGAKPVDAVGHSAEQEESRRPSRNKRPRTPDATDDADKARSSEAAKLMQATELPVDGVKTLTLDHVLAVSEVVLLATSRLP